MSPAAESLGEPSDPRLIAAASGRWSQASRREPPSLDDALLARFTPAALEVWVQQTKTKKVRYYKLNAPPVGSSQLDGYVDRQGFKR